MIRTTDRRLMTSELHDEPTSAPYALHARHMFRVPGCRSKTLLSSLLISLEQLRSGSNDLATRIPSPHGTPSLNSSNVLWKLLKVDVETQYIHCLKQVVSSEFHFPSQRIRAGTVRTSQVLH